MTLSAKWNGDIVCKKGNDVGEQEQFFFWDEKNIGKAPPVAPKKKQFGDQAIDIGLEDYGNVTVAYDNDYYAGKVSMPGPRNDVTWNYRRSGAAGLVASAMTAANIAALYLF